MKQFWANVDFLFWLKLASLLVTSVLGVIALLYKFEDKTDSGHGGEGRHLNLWGKMSLVGLVICAIVGVAAQIQETKEQTAKAKKQTTDFANLTDTSNRLVADVGKTLGDVQRNLVLIGDTIDVAYSFRMPLNNQVNKTFDYEVDLRAALQKLSQGDSNAQDTAAQFANGDKGKYVYSAVFGPRSPLMPRSDLQRLFLSTVPFRISFWKTRPKLQSGFFKVDYPSLQIKYDTLMNDASQISNIRISYENGEHSVIQQTLRRALFHAGANPGGVVSVLDFRGNFMLVETSGADGPPTQRGRLPVRFCTFSFKAGPLNFDIPLRDAEKDKAGGFLYHLPDAFDNLNSMTKRTFGQACPDFPYVPPIVSPGLESPENN